MSDREKLIELIKEAYCPVMCGFADEEKVKWLLELDIAYNWEDVADHLIANGAVIQKQGEWRYIEDDIYCYAQCSNCFAELVLDELTFEDVCEYSHCCPNCGAKMKEVK